MSAIERFYIRIDDLGRAEGEDRDFAFTGSSPASFAEEFQRGLRQRDLFKRWRDKQDDPDAVPDELSPCDPEATVEASGSDLHTDVVVTTDLPHRVVAHRLTLLIGPHWTLRDVSKV